MSTATEWAWSIRGLDASTRIVLMALAHRANNIGYQCFPSHKLIAEEAEVSVATVKRCVDKLVERKIVTVETRTRPGDKGQTSNIYRIMVKVDFHQPDGSVISELPPAQIELPPSSSGELPRTPKEELPSTAKAVSGRATSFPDDHAFRVLCVQWARENMKWSIGSTAEEFDRFKDNAADKGRVAKDWQAAWRNWCRSNFCTTKAEGEDGYSPFKYA